MNYRCIRFIALNIFLVFPLMTHGMFLALAKKNRYFSANSGIRRTFSRAGVSDLRDKIATPGFRLIETKKIIKEMVDLGKFGYIYEYGAENKLIEHIVFKATEHRKSEEQYASVLRQLREHGWGKSSHCKAVMLHSAVISNLPHVTQELLKHDQYWVYEKDLHDCVAIDYAQSLRIKKMLKNAGSRDAQPYTGEDLWYRVPDHGWQEVTPLRKAVYNGDWNQCRRILLHYGIQYYSDNRDGQSIRNEAKILMAIADLRFWRTDDEKYLEIREEIEAFYQDHMDWLWTNFYYELFDDIPCVG